MLKNHPKGLIVAFFANMGERFGYYTMLAIFTLFLQAKYGYSAAQATQIFGIFLAAVYFMPLFGGILADKVWGYGKTINFGLIVMFLGYLMIAIPTSKTGAPILVFAGLGVISLGTGLFKGNLQALVGNLYDDPKYSKNRDVAFNIFYMGINIGAMFAPSAAAAVYNFMLKGKGYTYNADIPALAHKVLQGKGMEMVEGVSYAEKLKDLAASQGFTGANLTEFANSYVDALSGSYHLAFGVACISLIVSMIVFWAFKKYYKHADMTEKEKAASEEHKHTVVEMSAQEVKQRLIALFMVFFVVMFFWMSFHQNGATMTIFARDYTVGSVSQFTNLWFDLFGLLPVFLAVIGLYFVIRKTSTSKTRMIGGISFVVFAILAYLRYSTYGDSNPFTPEKFQHFNPFFIVALTPIIVGLFSYLSKKGKEPSAPKKIGIGMLITSSAFILLAIGSIKLIGYSPGEIGEVRAPQNVLVSPYWLISTYFILTIAELFISPMGISFVSKVSPPQYKGLMQGGWLAATAVGNYGVAIVALFWSDLPLWAFWSVLTVLCLLSAGFIFAVLKTLERSTDGH